MFSHYARSNPLLFWQKVPAVLHRSCLPFQRVYCPPQSEVFLPAPRSALLSVLLCHPPREDPSPYHNEAKPFHASLLQNHLFLKVHGFVPSPPALPEVLLQSFLFHLVQNQKRHNRSSDPKFGIQWAFQAGCSIAYLRSSV